VSQKHSASTGTFKKHFLMKCTTKIVCYINSKEEIDGQMVITAELNLWYMD